MQSSHLHHPISAPCVSLYGGCKWREELCNILYQIKWLVLIVILNELLMNTIHSIIFVIMSDCRTVNCLQLSSPRSCIMLEIRVNGCSDTLKKKKNHNYKQEKKNITLSGNIYLPMKISKLETARNQIKKTSQKRQIIWGNQRIAIANTAKYFVHTNCWKQHLL